MFPPFTRPHGWTIEGPHLMTGPPSSNGHYSSINAHELAWGVALSARAGCESAGAEVAARRDAAMDAMVPKLQLVAIQLCVVHLLQARCQARQRKR